MAVNFKNWFVSRLTKEHALSALKVPSSHVIMGLLALVDLGIQNRI